MFGVQVSLEVLQFAQPPLEEVWVVLFTQGKLGRRTQTRSYQGKPWPCAARNRHSSQPDGLRRPNTPGHAPRPPNSTPLAIPILQSAGDFDTATGIAEQTLRLPPFNGGGGGGTTKLQLEPSSIGGGIHSQASIISHELLAKFAPAGMAR